VRGRSTAAIRARLRQSAHPRVEGPEFFSNPHIPVHHESVLASTLHRKRMTRPTSRVFKPLRKIGAGRCFPVCVCVDAPAPRCALRPQPTCIIGRAPAFEVARAAAPAARAIAALPQRLQSLRLFCLSIAGIAARDNARPDGRFSASNWSETLVRGSPSLTPSA
jgi:hypothetical protein